jgi:simple sugar transport system ATP-binding protein
MVGHAVEAPQRRPARSVGDAVCVLDHVSTASARNGGQDRLREVSLTLRAGEITAIAGVSGNGQVALAELLCGTRRAVSGTAQLMGRALPPSPARLVQRGVARIPEDRHAVGVVGDLPVWENAVSERLRSPVFSRWSFIVKRAAARLHARRIEKAFDVRGAGLMAPARSLSGGNMQKLILGRALLAPEQPEQRELREQRGGSKHDDNKKYPNRAPRLIVAHQPTWGLDIGAVAYVQQQLIAARDAGAAVLVISDDLDEVLTLGDRVAVMHGGHLGDARPAAAWTREAIGLAMAGATAGSLAGATAPQPKGAAS